MATGSGPSRRRVKLGVLAVSSLVTLILLEIGLRVFLSSTALLDPRAEAYWIANLREHPDLPPDIVLDPVLGWRMKPMLGGSSVSTNSRGLRGAREYEPSDTLRNDRILVLGDSLTFGKGIADGETYGSVLEALLPGLQVLVLGSNGYGLDQMLLLWREEGVRYRPAVVVLGYYVDNFHRSHLAVRERPKPRFVLEHGELRYEPPQALAEVDTGSRLRPRLADAFQWVLRGLRRRLAGGGEEPGFAARAELTARLLAELEVNVRASGARLCVVILPDPSFDRFHEAEPIRRSIVESCRTLGAACVDLSPILERAVAEDSSVGTLVHGHWPPAAHALIAREVAAVLRDEGLLP